MSKPKPKPGAGWPAALVEWRDVGKLKLRKTNPNTHTLEQIEQIGASLREWGWTFPILIDENDEILAGHGRVRAARMAGSDFAQCPVVVARGWSEAKKAAYVIADNQIARNSEWDPKLLRSEFAALKAGAFDVELLGFSEDELNKLVIGTTEKEAGDPETVIMEKCPHCGRHSTKKK